MDRASAFNRFRQVTLPGTLQGGELETEDVDVSIDLVRLLRVALRAVR